MKKCEMDEHLSLKKKIIIKIITEFIPHCFCCEGHSWRRFFPCHSPESLQGHWCPICHLLFYCLYSCQALASGTSRCVPGTLQDQDIRSKGTTWPSYLSGLFGTLLFKAAKVDGLLAKMSHSFLRGGEGRGWFLCWYHSAVDPRLLVPPLEAGTAD